MTKKALIDHLESIANTELPDRFYAYEEDELKDLIQYADNIVLFQNAGMDKLFESMSLTMKYIPKFMLVSLSKRFLEPPLAARITQKLTIKQVVTVGNELPATYLAEVSFYQDVHLSAKIFAALGKQHALDILQVMCDKYPLKVLDLFLWLTRDQQQFVAKNFSTTLINEAELHSQGRKKAYQQLGLQQS